MKGSRAALRKIVVFEPNPESWIWMLLGKVAEIRSKFAGDLGMALAPSNETMHANQICYATIVALVGAVACSGNHSLQNEDIQRQAALLSFNNCDELERYIKDVAVKYMRSQLEQSKAGVGVLAGARAADASPSTGAGPSAYTQTNTQVAGVDEADIVKSDGTRIFVLAGGSALYIVRSWPASQLSRSAKVPIEGFARDLFLVADANHPSALAPTAVVFSQLYAPYSAGQRGIAVPCPLNLSLRACGFPSAIKVTVLDISDEAQPRVTGEYYLPGSYDTSRRIGSSIRIVSNDFLRYPETVKWYPDATGEIYLDQANLSAAFDKLIRDNEVAIRSASLDQYLPESRHILPDGSIKSLPYQCTEFSRTNGPTEPGFVTVSTIDTSAGTFTRSSIVSNASVVYASAKALYVAAGHYWWWPQPGQKSFTYLHKFDLTQPTQAVYLGSGGVEGLVGNQFSMDEDVGGNLRVATSIFNRVSDPQSPWGHLEITNRLSVLSPQGTNLALIGQSEDFFPGEQIYGTRFVGERGYVVTFRRVDPLSVFDLRDPARPRKVGELEVPGFSTYLQPLDENHLLAIGEYLPPNNNWTGRSVQLSLFDVSDASHPIRSFNQLVGSSSAYSEAQYDHKAFTWFAEKGLLAIPFFDWNASAIGPQYWRDFVSGIRVFGVDVAQGISDKGMLSMRDVYQTLNYRTWSWAWAPMARRGLIASSDTDVFVYAVSDAGIRSANLVQLDTPLATVLFDAPTF
jgi:uncharacterized secreted protein with C-terminal beta-propeller domain